MTDTKELKEDIAYIRAAADRSNTNLCPVHISAVGGNSTLRLRAGGFRRRLPMDR